MGASISNLSIPIGTAGLPHAIVRFYTVSSPRAARFSVGWALLFCSILIATMPAIAEFARYNLITSLHDKTLTEIHALDWATKWENTGLLQFDDKNHNGRIELTPDDNSLEIQELTENLRYPENAPLALVDVGEKQLD